MRSLSVIAALALGGCYGSFPPEAEAGTRLRPRWAETPEGERGFGGWLDSELGGCFVARTSDGRLRCVPAQSGRIAYLDEDCGVPVVASEAGCEPHPFVYELRSAGDCATPPSYLEVYEVGGPVSAAEVFARTGDACLPIDAPGELRALTMVDPERFVGLDEVVEDAGGGRIVPRLHAADDGARQRIGFWDTARGAACGPPFGMRPGDPEQPCIPLDAREPVVGGLACDRDVAPPVGTCGPDATKAPPFAYEVERDACGHPTAAAQVWSTGSEPLSFGESCDPGLGVSGFGLIDAPDDALATMRVVAVGEGRLQLLAYEMDDGGRLPLGGLWDRELGLPCWSYLIEGTLRCVPVATAAFGATTVSTTVFADPACTAQTARPHVAFPGCALGFALGLSEPVCGESALAEIRPLEDLADPVYVLRSDGTCEERASGGHTYRVGDPVPPETFVELTAVEG